MASDPSSSNPLTIHDLFRSLLAQRTSENESSPPQSPIARSLISSPNVLNKPKRHTIRFIDDQNRRREKFDGTRWRPVCIWPNDGCSNFAWTGGLCKKHRHPTPRRSTKLIEKLQQNNQLSSPTLIRKQKSILSTATHALKRNNTIEDDDDLQILEEYTKLPAQPQQMKTIPKMESNDFSMFSLEHLDRVSNIPATKSEAVSPHDDIQFLSQETLTNSINTNELLSKNLPPLTDFEEDYLATTMIQHLPPRSLLLDAQFYLHQEAIRVVKRNYRAQMKTIAHEYFYDFLLRHPRVAMHFSHWFMKCKPVPPTTGDPIDMKVWTLGMMVRGATSQDPNIDECEA